MPFHALGAGVLGPRLSTSPNQAYFAGSSSHPPGVPQPPVDPWNHQALLAALNATNSSAAPQAAEWFMDTGASSHMSSNTGKFTSSTPVYNSTPIVVGNGATLPVTHRASTHIPTARSPLSLPNVLVSPSLVKNLISVRSLTRDNNVSVEFDAFGFSVKDLPTRSVILRCNSDDEFYPLAPSPLEALAATSTPTVEL